MTGQHGTPSPWSTSSADAAAKTTVQPGAPETSAKARRRSPRPWLRKKRLSLPLALVIVVAIGLAVNARSDPATVRSPARAKVVAVAADIGMKVRDGTFDFVVTGVEYPGKSFMGKVGKTLTAQGEFVIVRVDVTNVGTKAVRLGSSCQFLFSEKGQEFATSPAILSTKDALKYVSWINPGDTVKGASMLFDVAPGTKAGHIGLHASQSSAGVKVKLS